MGIIPDKLTVTVTLQPDSASPTVITSYRAWRKPLEVNYHQFGGVNVQGDETIINIPDDELNPAKNGREIRTDDRFTIAGINYNVIASKVKVSRTVWECMTRREMA